MIILLFIESRLNFKNIPLNSTFKSSINYEYIVYRNENPISCFLEFIVSSSSSTKQGRVLKSPRPNYILCKIMKVTHEVVKTALSYHLFSRRTIKVFCPVTEYPLLVAERRISLAILVSNVSRNFHFFVMFQQHFRSQQYGIGIVIHLARRRRKF